MIIVYVDHDRADSRPCLIRLRLEVIQKPSVETTCERITDEQLLQLFLEFLPMSDIDQYAI